MDIIIIEIVATLLVAILSTVILDILFDATKDGWGLKAFGCFLGICVASGVVFAGWIAWTGQHDLDLTHVGLAGDMASRSVFVVGGLIGLAVAVWFSKDRSAWVFWPIIAAYLICLILHVVVLVPAWFIPMPGPLFPPVP